MKHLILLLSFALPLCLFATGDSFIDEPLAEDIPLYYSYEDYLIHVYEKLGESLDASKLRFRMQVEPDAQEFYAHAGHKALNLKLRIAQDDGEPHYGFELRQFDAKKKLELCLGNYRYRFGLGLVSGTGSSGLASISSPGHPNYYYPRGLAVRINHLSIEGGAWLSAQSRVSSLKDSLISSLPRKKSDGLVSTNEEILGFYIGKQNPNYSFGTLFYRQSYDRGFEEDKSGDMEALSIYARLRLPRLELRAETALAGGQHAVKVVCKYTQGKTGQTISLSKGTDFVKSAYASNLHSLSSNPEAWEIQHSWSHQIHQKLGYQLSYSVHRFGDSFLNPKYLSRMQFNLAYRDSISLANLRIQRIDREILSLADSSYISTRPHHWRFSMDARHRINHSLSLRLGISYHFEERSSYSNNAFWWSGILDWEKGAWQQSLRLQSWQTVRDFYLIQTDIDGMEYSISESSKDALLLSWNGSYAYKRLQIGLRAGLSLLDTRASEILLRLDYR